MHRERKPPYEWCDRGMSLPANTMPSLYSPTVLGNTAW